MTGSRARYLRFPPPPRRPGRVVVPKKLILLMEFVPDRSPSTRMPRAGHGCASPSLECRSMIGLRVGEKPARPAGMGCEMRRREP